MMPLRQMLACTTLLAAAAWLGSCASTATRLPDISEPDLQAEARLQEGQALATVTQNLARLQRVGRAVLLANAEICPDTRRDIGVITHTEDDYSKEMRDAARRELGAGETPTVRLVAPGSPADRAGMKPGDAILVGGEAVRVTDKDFEALIEADTLTLSVRRGDDVMSLALEPDTLCRSRIRMRNSPSINAFANGRNITMMTGMMDFTQDDDELALILGHELAHNTMGHIRKVVGNLILSGFATRYTRPFESEADYVGLYYMVRAGFDPEGVEDVWRRLADVNPRSVNRAKSHPTFPDRFVRIAAARAEIEAKQAAGEPLVPNFKSDADAR
jgi:hypothetical protein